MTIDVTTAGDSARQERVARARRRKISLVIAQDIVRQIALDQLTPGCPLPTEQAMAAQFGVGRASIREALRVLELQGIIEIRRGNGGGPVVGRRGPQRFGETMTMHLQLACATMRDVNEAMIQLEPLSAERAAQRVHDGSADPAAIAAVVEESRRGMARVTEQNLSSQDYVDSGSRFHLLVRDVDPNPVLDLLTESVSHIFASRTADGGANLFSNDTRTRLHFDHIRIADAIQAGDAETARALMRDHMASAARAIFEIAPDLAEDLVDWQ
ncbi:FadR/GntR family transcriptional regulator [Mycolicibacterium holsaticum]|uniref:FadR/GntR family transcriptional regulator n=1 Tax=Mycolicibacterium holsaticum TaxID=152142 RepID=UPI001C7D2E7D|nr:GntR family transcriptional regulator [Mycolicibacterium holsaticum]MDA4108132.1 GntR family transcriptional regulator [Mycolicibacterium holsaticum DSM 44478 = JCM 12374]QZA14456.1 GntR family transcriptional regulator [Mycolicibacterium holsaticum DSM 44478 = JCM 12374]UNC08095.1 FadR family transcriptional regulator [Mycolicibacterium holsaticum DSM 44478 = JCM 12374]